MTRSAAIRQSARARSTFARLHGVFAEDVAIGHQVSPMVGLDCRVPASASARAGGRGRLHLAAVSAARRRLRRAHDPAGAARRRGRQPHRPGGRLRRPIRRRTARRFGRHLQRSSQLRRTDVGRRHPGVRLAPARRRAVLSRGDGWVQMAMPPTRDRVHDDRARAARPDRPDSPPAGTPASIPGTPATEPPCDSPATPAASTSRPLG